MERERSGRALILFESVRDAMKAEKSLKGVGYRVRVVAPPPEVRMGCDLAVEIDVMQRVGIEKQLKKDNIVYMDVVLVEDVGLRPLELIKEVDFGDYVMVRCGNMKVAFEKRSGVIVNVSGGGCPDVPYLNISLVGKKLTEAPHPQSIGYTLCAYTAGKAYERANEIWRSRNPC